MAMSQQDVELYLRDNPEFVKQWFSTNVDRVTMERWTEEGAEESGQLKVPEPTTYAPGRNSITSNMFQEMIQGKRKTSTRRQIAKEELLKMNEKELFMELIRDIANELDVNNLCFKILVNVGILTKSDCGSLFLVKGPRTNRHLVSKLFNVSEKSNLESSLHTEENQIRVPFGIGIAGTVAASGMCINIENAYEDARFNKEVDKRTGYHTRSILCMPIFNYDGDVIGVAQIINKTEGGEVFTEEDESVFKDYLTFCGIGLTNAQLFEMSVQEFKRNKMLLNLARGIFEEQANLDNLVKKIMKEAQELLKCERCNVYLVDTSMNGANFLYNGPAGHIFEQYKLQWLKYEREEKETFVKQHEALKSIRKKGSPLNSQNMSKEQGIVFSTAFELRDDTGEVQSLSQEDIKKAKSAEMARSVAASGEILNVADAVSDPRFGKEEPPSTITFSSDTMIDYDGLNIRNLLSLPIRSAEHNIIGVVQLINKCNGKMFADHDVNIVEAFAIFCGLGIHNCQMYENACKLMAKQSVALEVLSYHATAPVEETERLQKSEIPPAEQFQLYNYDFNDFALSEFETCKATLRMFIDMDFVNKFHVPYDVMCRWILSVKKNYRPVTYHNWRHAFNVAQTMFTMLTTGKMGKYMSDLEMFSLIVACLCHDLDHRGTNNTFQSKAESPLAQLYGTSTMEHHHFDQCIMILNSPGNNIFMSLSAEDYRAVISIVEMAILSTDLALYFKKKGAFANLVKDGEKKWKDPEKKELLRGMMMTACDVAAISKPWEIQHKVAHLIADEFFEQGDIERSKLGEEPIAMMDRRKKDEFPTMQVGFINAICLPVYEMLANVDQGLKPLLQGCQNNRQNWQSLADEQDNKPENDNHNGKNENKEITHNGTNPNPSSSKDNQSLMGGQKQTGSVDNKSTKKESKTCTIL